MAAPIDEGRPTFTSRASATFTMANLATAFRAYMWDPDADDHEFDLSVYVPAPAKIYDEDTFTFVGPGLSSLHLNLHVLNALTYGDQPINKVLLDILVHQAHVGRLVKRLLPNGDAGVNAWTRSSGSSDHYTYVDEPFDAPATGNFLSAASANLTEKFDLEAVPANVVRVHEAIVMAWMAMTDGTDTGMGIQAVLTDSSDVPLGALGTSEALLDCVIDGTSAARAVRGKMEALDTVAATFNGARLHMISKRGAAGGAPNPLWYLYAVEVLVYCEINDVAIVNTASFTAQDSYCSAYPLRFSEWDGTFGNLVMDVLGHRASLFLYIDWQGQIALGKIAKFSDVTTPLDISSFITNIVRGPYKYTERAATVVEVRWGSIPRHVDAGTATEDPVNDIPDRGSRRLRIGATAVAERGFEDAITLDRHYIAGTANAGIARTFAEEYVDIWGNEIDAFEIECDMRAIEAEPGDVVYIDRPDLGITDKKLTVVANPFDADDDTVRLVLYKVECTI